jgi:poly(3-hydroxybutyrate) depolymerase
MTTMSGWAMRDGCGSSPTTYQTIGDATCIRWPTCAAGADVALCSVTNGVHEWFGGGTAWVDGGPPQGFNATTFLADFFSQHPML